MYRGANSKFKRGDIVSPLPHRANSNGISLKNLKKLKIRETRYRDWDSEKWRVDVIIIEGYFTPYYGSTRREGTVITLMEDCLEQVHKTDVYEIY